MELTPESAEVLIARSKALLEKMLAPVRRRRMPDPKPVGKRIELPQGPSLVIRPGRTIEKIPRKRTTRSKAARAERRHKREQRAIR